MQERLDLLAQRVDALEVAQHTERHELAHVEHGCGFRARAHAPKRVERGLDQLGEDGLVSECLHQFREAMVDHGVRSKSLFSND